MKSNFLTSLYRQRQNLQRELKLVNQLIQLMEAKRSGNNEEPHSENSQESGFPYFGMQFEKIVFALCQIGRFCRKEEIIDLIEAYQSETNTQTIATVLSRKVGKGQLASIHYNRSNLYVFYGLPSFLNLSTGEMHPDRQPRSVELADLRVTRVTVYCGGVLRDEDADFP